MGFSPLADMSKRIPEGGRSNPRNSKISGFTIHHQAGVNGHGAATNPAREVSANYWIDNDGTIRPQIDEVRRAWTSGHPNYPAGAQADHRNITVEVSNSPEGVRSGTWAISDAALKSLISLIGDVFSRHGLGRIRRAKSGGVAVHKDFVPTECPGGYIMRNLSHIIAQAEKARKGDTPKPNPTPPKPPKTGGKTLAQLAREVYRGDWGNGTTRTQRLTAAGYDAAAVQREVDRRYYGGGGSSSGGSSGGSSRGGASATIRRLADEVMAGKHGNGPARRKSLGSNYQAVQNEVNRRLYGGGSTSGGASSGGSTGGKSLATLAAEVYRGDWGNDPQRSQRLRAAGHDPAAVQREVNRRYYS